MVEGIEEIRVGWGEGKGTPALKIPVGSFLRSLAPTKLRLVNRTIGRFAGFAKQQNKNENGEVPSDNLAKQHSYTSPVSSRIKHGGKVSCLLIALTKSEAQHFHTLQDGIPR